MLLIADRIDAALIVIVIVSAAIAIILAVAAWREMRR